MKNRHLRICTNCVMDTTDSSINFDKDGVCDHCRKFYTDILPNWPNDSAGYENLKKNADLVRKSGRYNDHDCLIGVSGGVDSSYLVFLAKKILDLRPLVLHVDTGWNSQLAVNNIERLIDGLNVDLATVVIDWEEMRDLQLSFFKSGVPHIDTPQDHAIFASLYNFAEKNKIKYILTGANYSTECIRNPIEWMYYQSDSKQISDIHKQYGSSPLLKFPITNVVRHKIFLRYILGIKVLKPLNHVKYIRSEAMEFLESEFGWQPYPQKHFESRFTKFYESYWLPEKFGFDTRKVQFSSLILTGQKSREEALEELSDPAYDPDTISNDIEFICRKLGISEHEFNAYMNQESRSYKDYKSQRRLYSIGAKVSRLVGLERGGKR